MGILGSANLLPALEDKGLSPLVTDLLTPYERLPDGTENLGYAPHLFREDRLRRLPGFRDLQREMVARRFAGELPFLTYVDILDTWQDSQDEDETHRMLTPRIQEMMYYPDTRKQLLEGIDKSAEDDTERLIKEAKKNSNELQCDLIIIGSGPHGQAAAARARHENPRLKIWMIESGDKLGGQWRNNGPEASFMMNSRVRRPNNNLPNTPRTPGNINPLGRWATMELADTVLGNYATNVETGGSVAVNEYLNIDAAMIGTDCDRIYDYGDYARARVMTKDGTTIIIQAGATIVAAGIRQESTLSPTVFQEGSPFYYNSQQLYRHFGNHAGKAMHQPLAEFSGKTVIAVGGGDSLLTGAEALVGGTLPRDSYGPYGVGRNRVESYTWVGAPGIYASEIDICLRSRYKNGIVQALPKNSADCGAVIRPMQQRARGFDIGGNGVTVYLEDGSIVTGDVLLDHTNRSLGQYGPSVADLRPSRLNQSAVFNVGPGAGLQLPPEKIQVINDLGIGENTVALWALVGLTDKYAQEAGRLASTRKRSSI
jgi:hypothetical protein